MLSAASSAARGAKECNAREKNIDGVKFDLLLSSDTIYSSSSIPPLFHLLRNLLSQNGCALIAAKRFYFGVGGSTAEFIQYSKRWKDMECEVVKVLEDGKSNVREILRLSFVN